MAPDPNHIFQTPQDGIGYAVRDWFIGDGFDVDVVTPFACLCMG